MTGSVHNALHNGETLHDLPLPSLLQTVYVAPPQFFSHELPMELQITLVASVCSNQIVIR